MKIPFLILSFMWLITACTNSNIQPTQAKQLYADAIQLAKGNYWIYESRSKNFSTSDVLNPNDSTFIKTDSLINGHIYYQLENTFGLSLWKRDSLCYIVGLDGRIEFSAKNTTDTLYRTIDGVMVSLMGGRVEQVNVPAGTFSAIFFCTLERIPEGGAAPSKSDPSFFNDRFSLLNKVWYAKGVGIVKSEVYYSGSTYQLNLIRFHLKK